MTLTATDLMSRIKADNPTYERIQKSDLALRPVWHQREDRVKAHILVCFLGYVLWKTLGKMCQAAGLGDCPRKVFDELSQLRMVDVILPTKQGVEIRRRCVERPDLPHVLTSSASGSEASRPSTA